MNKETCVALTLVMFANLMADDLYSTYVDPSFSNYVSSKELTNNAKKTGLSGYLQEKIGISLSQAAKLIPLAGGISMKLFWLNGTGEKLQKLVSQISIPDDLNSSDNVSFNHQTVISNYFSFLNNLWSAVLLCEGDNKIMKKYDEFEEAVQEFNKFCNYLNELPNNQDASIHFLENIAIALGNDGIQHITEIHKNLLSIYTELDAKLKEIPIPNQEIQRVVDDIKQIINGSITDWANLKQKIEFFNRGVPEKQKESLSLFAERRIADALGGDGIFQILAEAQSILNKNVSRNINFRQPLNTHYKTPADRLQKILKKAWPTFDFSKYLKALHNAVKALSIHTSMEKIDDSALLLKELSASLYSVLNVYTGADAEQQLKGLLGSLGTEGLQLFNDVVQNVYTASELLNTLEIKENHSASYIINTLRSDGELLRFFVDMLLSFDSRSRVSSGRECTEEQKSPESARDAIIDAFAQKDKMFFFFKKAAESLAHTAQLGSRLKMFANSVYAIPEVEKRMPQQSAFKKILNKAKQKIHGSPDKDNSYIVSYLNGMIQLFKGLQKPVSTVELNNCLRVVLEFSPQVLEFCEVVRSKANTKELLKLTNVATFNSFASLIEEASLFFMGVAKTSSSNTYDPDDLDLAQDVAQESIDLLSKHAKEIKETSLALRKAYKTLKGANFIVSDDTRGTTSKNLILSFKNRAGALFTFDQVSIYLENVAKDINSKMRAKGSEKELLRNLMVIYKLVCSLKKAFQALAEPLPPSGLNKTVLSLKNVYDNFGSLVKQTTNDPTGFNALLLKIINGMETAVRKLDTLQKSGEDNNSSVVKNAFKIIEIMKGTLQALKTYGIQE